MKRNCHPKSFPCQIELADGTTFSINLGVDRGIIKTNVDYSNHPAWNKNTEKTSIAFEEIAKFKEKFEDLEI